MPQRAPRTASQPSAGNPRLHAPPLPAGLGLLCPCSWAFLLRVDKAGGVQGGNKVWGSSVLKWVVAMGMELLTQTCGPWLGNSCQLREPPRLPPGKYPTPASSRLQVGVGANGKLPVLVGAHAPTISVKGWLPGFPKKTHRKANEPPWDLEGAFTSPSQIPV